MRYTEFEQKLLGEFGSSVAETILVDHVFFELGSRRVKEAISQGVELKDIWRAICIEFQIPFSRW